MLLPVPKSPPDFQEEYSKISIHHLQIQNKLLNRYKTIVYSKKTAVHDISALLILQHIQ